jgi:hypothetical protein
MLQATHHGGDCMPYFLSNPGMLILYFLTIMAWLLLLIGVISLLSILKKRISWGPGFNSPKHLIFSMIFLLIGLLIHFFISVYGHLFFPPGL